MDPAHAMIDFIATRDHRLMRRVNRWSAPRWVRVWMLCASRGGDGWLWYAVGIALLIYDGSRALPAVVAAALAGVLSTLAFLLLKRMAARRRPCDFEPHCWASLLPPDQFSFPSGHTMAAFAIAVPLSLFYPPLTAGLLFCAVSIAISRILLGMHFLSDVIAGAMIGASAGYAVAALFR